MKPLSDELEIRYVTGDALYPVEDGLKFILHVVNDSGGWGRGFVVNLSKRWKNPEIQYRAFHHSMSLGDNQYVHAQSDIVVVNMMAQHGYQPPTPLDYHALTACLHKASEFALSYYLPVSFHMPRIGCGLGGGEWSVVAGILEKTIHPLIPVTVYDLPQ